MFPKHTVFASVCIMTSLGKQPFYKFIFNKISTILILIFNAFLEVKFEGEKSIIVHVVLCIDYNVY